MDPAADAAPTTDAVSVIEDEHRTLQSLFERVSKPDEDRPEVLKQIVRLLSSHVGAEKQLVVPVVRERVPDGELIADHLSDYHDEVEHILITLDRRKVNSPDVPALVTDLLRLTDTHVAEAQNDLFPALRQALTADELDELGGRMLSDERLTTSHPHPHLPQSGPLKKIAGEVASIVDRVRDRSTDIGRSGG
jgi:hypothetical protein